MDSKQSSIWWKNKYPPYVDSIFNDSYHFVLLQYICNVALCRPVFFLCYAFYHIDFRRADMLVDPASAAQKGNAADCGSIVVWCFAVCGT